MVVTYSVGGLSALNAVACAYAEDLPVIVVVGGINSDSEWEDKIIHHALGEVRYDYQREIYAQVTAGAFSVRHVADAPAIIDGAIDLALRRRKPVMLGSTLTSLRCRSRRRVPGTSARRQRATPPLWPTPRTTPPSC
jgi:pyruvate decarboxylase